MGNLNWLDSMRGDPNWLRICVGDRRRPDVCVGTPKYTFFQIGNQNGLGCSVGAKLTWCWCRGSSWNSILCWLSKSTLSLCVSRTLLGFSEWMETELSLVWGIEVDLGSVWVVQTALGLCVLRAGNDLVLCGQRNWHGFAGGTSFGFRIWIEVGLLFLS